MLRTFAVFCVLMSLVSPAQALRVQAACTKDAKVCPDGTSVGRVGPSCEFALCPGETAPQQDAPGVVDGSTGEGEADDGAAAKPQPQPAPGAEDEQDQVMCTMDAKICPDGSGVGRTGPNCEFAPCPGE